MSSELMYAGISKGDRYFSITSSAEMGGQDVVNYSQNSQTGCPISPMDTLRNSICDSIRNGIEGYMATLGISLFPIPFQESLQLSWEEPIRKPIEVFFFSTQGVLLEKQIKLADLNRENLYLNTEKLPQGVYFITVRVGNIQGVFKAVKI